MKPKKYFYITISSIEQYLFQQISIIFIKDCIIRSSMFLTTSAYQINNKNIQLPETSLYIIISHLLLPGNINVKNKKRQALLQLCYINAVFFHFIHILNITLSAVSCGKLSSNVPSQVTAIDPLYPVALLQLITRASVIRKPAIHLIHPA